MPDSVFTDEDFATITAYNLIRNEVTELQANSFGFFAEVGISPNAGAYASMVQEPVIE